MEQYLGEIRLFACTFVPANWASCNGALLQIRQSTALFSLLGTQYGGQRYDDLRAAESERHRRAWTGDS